MTMIGIFGFKDPLRSEVSEVVALMQNKMGINVRIVTEYNIVGA